MNFRENLKRMRRSKGFTQAEFGKLIGKSQVTVGRYETCDIIPSADVLCKIAKVLDCTVGELFGEEPKVIYKDYPNVGRWEVYQLKELGEAWTVQCSVCKAIGFHGKTPFCPECGARME